MKVTHPYDVESQRLACRTTPPCPCAQHHACRIALVTFLLLKMIPPISMPAEDSVPQLLLAPLRHLRSGKQREWNNFPEQAHAGHLELSFTASPDQQISTLSLRQQDVKQLWSVTLNGKLLGRLQRDENDMRVYLPVPAGTLRETGNHLKISSTAQRGTDDIRVGEITLHPHAPNQAVSYTHLTLPTKA